MGAGLPAAFPRWRTAHWAWLILPALMLVGVGCQPTANTATMRGVLVAVESSSLQRFESFVLRADDGQELTFGQAPDFAAGGGHAMTPGHMRQHMVLAEPVRVTYRRVGDRLLAVMVEDAP